MQATSPSQAKRRSAILGVIIAAAVLDLLDATITNVAAPTIAADLGGGAALIQWLGAAYALALRGSLLVVGGRLGDRGMAVRRLFLLGITGLAHARVRRLRAWTASPGVARRCPAGAGRVRGVDDPPRGSASWGSVFPP